MLTICTSVRVYGITLFTLLLVSFSVDLYANDSPSASNGVLDLTSWDFIAAGNVNLKGEWAFYWDKLIPPEAFLNSDISSPKTILLPRNWNNFEIDGKRLGPEGFATFRLLVKLKKSYSPLALKIPNIDSAYKLWINGKLIAEIGQIGKTAQDSVPQLLPFVAGFANDSKTLDIVIQVSNFGYTKGGIWSVPLLGLQRHVYEERENQNMISLFLVGSFVIMCFYHLGLYLLRSKETITLVFCLICFSLSFRILVGGEALFFQWFSSIPWEVGIKLAYTTFILPPGLIVLFFYFLYPQDISKKIILGILGIIFFIFILILFLSPLQVGVLLLLFEITLLASMAYAVFFFTHVIKRKRQGAVVMLISLVVLIGSGVNDILNDINVLDTGYYAPFGMFTLIFSQSWILAKKFTKAFNDVENLTEQLLKMDKLKDEFIANTSHELKTPINGIVGIADSLIDGAAGQVGEEMKNNLMIIVNSGQRLSNLVNDILDFSKLKHNTIELQTKPTDLKVLVDIVFMLSKPLTEDKSLKLFNRLQTDSFIADVDENRIQQILHNLVGNAIKFTNTGEIIVSAEIKKGRIYISVSDTGIGILKEKQKQIFESFQQVDGSIARIYGGTGLGLTISRQLAQLHGGDIEVVSEPDKGAMFTFSVPISDKSVTSMPSIVSLQELDDEALMITGPVESTNGTEIADVYTNILEGTKKPNILVVDDEPVNRQVLNNQLVMRNCQITEASSGQKALDMIEQNNHFDLILLDIMMPKMSGYEVCQKIRERYSNTELPILMLTAKNRSADLIAGLDSGANDYLTKPFSKTELLARIKTQLQLAKQSRDLKTYNEQLEDKVEERTLELKSSLEETKLKEQEISQINEMIKIVNSTLSLDRVMKSVIDVVKSIFEFDYLLLAIVNEKTEHLSFQKGYGEELSEEKLLKYKSCHLSLLNSNSVYVNILKANKPILYSPITPKLIKSFAEEDKKIYNILPVKAAFICPIEVQEKVIGVVCFGNKNSPIEIAEETFEKVNRYIFQVASAVNNARLFNELSATQIKLAESNKLVTSSIEYSQLIQKSIFPDVSEIKKYLPNSFFLWKPRSIVGGDFYQFYEMDGNYLLIVGDCTGHGVPGAFMTMITLTLLERVIFAEKIQDPASILSRLSQLIKITLKQKRKKTLSNEGLDGAVCLIKPKEKKLIFASANTPLICVNNGSSEMFKGDRNGVGYKRTPIDFQFTSRTIDIEAGKRFYLYSDGIVDQIGGDKKISFGRKRLLNFFAANYNQPFIKQQELLQQTIKDYQGDNSTQDDITVIGFQL